MRLSPGSPGVRQVIVGGYTAEMDGHSVGITRSLILATAAAGADVTPLPPVELLSPSYLIEHPHQPWIFAVSESEPGRLTSWALGDDPNGDGATLVELGSVAVGGDGPCHLAVSPDAEHLVVASYGSGAVSTFSIGSDGQLSHELDLLQLTGSGPDPERQSTPHAHQAVFDGDELLVCDLGTDQIHRLRLDPHGLLSRSAPPLRLPTGSGPRHLVVIDDHLVVACELSAEVWLGRRSPGGWEGVRSVPASQTVVDARIYPSAIVAEGSRIYLGNRGAGTVTVFDLDADADDLHLVSEFPCGGSWPRDLKLDQSRLWVANQTDDRIDVFSVETLPPPGPELEITSPSPACLLLLDIPESPADLER